MKGTRQPKVSAISTLGVGASLLINVYLVAHLLSQKSAAPAVAETGHDIASAQTQPPSAPPATSETTDAIASEAPTLRWSEIESADYRQYIANLRALGVPEQVIRDIIVADVNQLYANRARDIWQRRVREYWQKSANEKPNPKQMGQLMAIGQEQSAMLKDLLGVRISRQELIDTLFLQVQGSERQLLFLPSERREAALRALADADFESKEMKFQSQGSYLTKDEQKLFNEKLAALADVLSPEELEEFHRRNSPAGLSLKSELRYFNLTPEEYKQLLLAKESAEGRQSTKEVVQGLFGDERAKEFERVSSAFYINARIGADAEGVPLDRVDQAAAFASDSMTAGLATAQNKSLSVEERKARLKELQSQAETKIKDLLGDKASQTVLRDLRNVLRSSTSHIQP
jgi:hypothetical protein